MKRSLSGLFILILSLMLFTGCEEGGSSLNPEDYEIYIRMDGTYFIAYVSHVSDDDWTSEGKASFTADGLDLEYSSDYDNYYVYLEPSDYAAGDVITVNYQFDDLEAKSISINIPDDISGTLSVSPSLPAEGSQNSETEYTITPSVSGDVDRFYISIEKYDVDDSTADYNSRWRWYNFSSITTTAENMYLWDSATGAYDESSVAPYLKIIVFGCDQVSDSSYYADVDFYAVGRTGYSVDHISDPPPGVSLGVSHGPFLPGEVSVSLEN